MKGRSTQKKKHAQRRAHQREMRRKKTDALNDAITAAISMSADGTKVLNRPRTGKAYDEALVREMEKRGYRLEKSWRVVKAVGQKPVKVQFDTWKRMTPAEIEAASTARKKPVAKKPAVSTEETARPIRRGVRRKREAA